MSEPLPRRAARAFFRQVMRLYFRDVEVVGAPAPSVSGRLFAGNHENALIDPVLVLTATDAPMAPLAKSTLWKIPVLSSLLRLVDAVPVVRRKDTPDKSQAANDAVFDRVAEHLAGGGNVLIFPEGTSHNEPSLQPLRTGAGRMLMRAQQGAGAGASLSLQAVALQFEDRDAFRSRALVLFGPVRTVDAIARDAGDGEALVAAITARLQADLAELMVEGSTWDERRLIARVAELLAHEADDDSLARWNEIGRQVEAARRTLGRDDVDPRYRAVADAVGAYYDLLDDAGLTDERLVAGAASHDARWALRSVALTLSLPLAAIGGVAYFVPYQLTRFARKMAKGDEDVISTYKLGLGLVLFPAWAGGLVAGSLLLLPPPISWLAAATAVASPFAALVWLDRLEARRGVRSLLRMTGRGRQVLARLREARAHAIAVINDARSSLEPNHTA